MDHLQDQDVAQAQGDSSEVRKRPKKRMVSSFNMPGYTTFHSSPF